MENGTVGVGAGCAGGVYTYGISFAGKEPVCAQPAGYGWLFYSLG